MKSEGANVAPDRSDAKEDTKDALAQLSGEGVLDEAPA